MYHYLVYKKEGFQFSIVAWVSLPGIGEHVPKVPHPMGAWELIVNSLKLSGASIGTLELFGNFTATNFWCFGSFNVMNK